MIVTPTSALTERVAGRAAGVSRRAGRDSAADDAGLARRRCCARSGRVGTQSTMLNVLNCSHPCNNPCSHPCNTPATPLQHPLLMTASTHPHHAYASRCALMQLSFGGRGNSNVGATFSPSVQDDEHCRQRSAWCTAASQRCRRCAVNHVTSLKYQRCPVHRHSPEHSARVLC